MGSVVAGIARGYQGTTCLHWEPWSVGWKDVMADPRRHRIDSWLPGMPSLPAVDLNGTSPQQLPSNSPG